MLRRPFRFRRPQRLALEQHYELSAAQLRKVGAFTTAPRCPSHTLAWERGAARHKLVIFGPVQEGDGLILPLRWYLIDQIGKEYLSGEDRVELLQTPCHYGGSRFWFRCPISHCARRIAILYLSDHGHGLVYCRLCRNHRAKALSRYTTSALT